MEVLRGTTTTTGRPRFMSPAESPSATTTMTRSAISHHPQQQKQLCTSSSSSNGQSSTPASAADTSIRDKTRLLQLAEKVHTRKSASPNYTKSFRALTSVVSKSASNNTSSNELVATTPTVRRTNSTMLTSSSLSAPPSQPVSRAKMENYKNPKLYASFSSKSSSKLTKALIKRDPAKTNIEHLVNYKSNTSPPRCETNHNGNSVSGKIPENGELHGHHHHHHHQNGGGGGLSSFITPLKALHASFHERSSKLGQTRSKLFSHHHRDISTSNAKLLFDTTENLHSSGGSGSCSSSSAEDILATEILPPSKRPTNNNKTNPQDSKQRRSMINNNKNVASGSVFSTATLRRHKPLQNGSSKVPPDFLEGFRNENSFSSSNGHYDNDNNGHHATGHEINGSDKTTDLASGQNAHEQEVNNTNNATANSFITPDILGGCLDIPKGTATAKSTLVTRNGNNSTSNGRYRISDAGDKKLADELRQANDTGYNNSAITNGKITGTNNGRNQSVTPQQPHLNGSSSNNKEISQKRKNIVVRINFHEDETSSYDDLYRVLSNGDSNTINENGHEILVDHVDNQVDIWPTSSLTVSTVTPKRIPTSSARSDNASSSFSRDLQVITPVTNNYCGEDVRNNATTVATTAVPMAYDNTTTTNNNVSNSLYKGNSLSTFRPVKNNRTSKNNSAGGGGAVQHQQHRTVSSSAQALAIANSSTLKTTEDELRNLKLSQTTSNKSLLENDTNSSISGRGYPSAHTLQDHQHNNISSNKIELPSYSPGATGSQSWLETKNSFSPTVSNLSGETNCINDFSENNVKEEGSMYRKQLLTKTVSSPETAVRDKIISICPNALSNYNNSKFINLPRNGDKACGVIENIDETNGNDLSVDNKEEERGKDAREGVFMEAETSFAYQRSRGGGRPQTALLSDEYAQYLGYDYDNKDNLDKKVQQQQQQQQATQTRLQVLPLGNNKCNPPTPCSEDGENDDVFGEDERNTMMLAITTTTSPSRRSKKGITSIMKPQHGNRKENRKAITHSVSFRGTIDAPYYSSSAATAAVTQHHNLRRLYHLREESDGNESFGGKSSRIKLGLSESFNKFDRKRSRSLPKSFMSMKNGLRNVLPSQWVRDGAFERLDEPDITFPKEEKTKPANEIEQGDEEPTANDIEAIKMRWHKLGGSSSSSFSDRRPKSFDYAQRKAWMKLYRDMEVSQASGSSSISSSNPRISRPLSKGSITHLHLQETPSDLTASRDSVDEGDAASLSAMMRSTDISSTSPSLFKRFSKTFSLRFGSGTNVSKHGATGEVHRKSKSKGAIGSSPDLFNRVEMDASRDKVNGKMRKSNVKSVRGDKCQSGDSGIGMDEQQSAEPRHHASNLRRIRSDYISPTAMGLPSTSSSASAYAGRALTNGANKLSLVEIPDHSWDEHNSSPTEGSGASDTTSYEDLVDAKLDQDDGFSSSDEGQRPEQLQNPGYYHSLPHRKHSKRRLKETESTNSCGEVPKEDNSIRGKVVWEIILTEQNYVKTLNDIVQGFLNPCRARNDLFSSRTVQNIFSNIEEILRLHVKFLEALKSKVDPSFVSKSNVGGVFTSWADRFSLYSEYCCNNPISVATVRSLVQFPQYAEFFEACRRLQMMDKLPLHGFLLRPIQRICQYHLQLNELLKHTEESHADHKSVVEALETMKSVATKINDTQRQFESLQEIIRFQNSIDGWEGPNLVDRNAVILHKGELVKVTYGRKQKEVFVAVLNKDLIYCKKDFMKKSGYVFDGRIDLNLRMWINIDSNEEDEFFGMVHNSWRIYSRERRAWILFTAATPSEKRKWIGALEKTKEEIFVDPKLREMAVVTTALAESEISSNGSPHGHHSNTLPKSSKKSKVKQQLSTKVDQDAMLIEVGKLRRSSLYATSSSKEGSSKFYV